MPLHILLFVIYSLLCVYGILKISFIRKSGIRPAFLLLFFALHVFTGLIHNSISYRFYPEHGDIWNFYQWSFLYRHRLTSDLTQFLADNSSLTHFTHNSIIWIEMLLNLFSFDNLTINTLLLSFPVFMGNIALFRLFRKRFPDASLAACSVFVLPSTLFWTSCIHREAVLFMLLGFLFFTADRWLTQPGSIPRLAPDPRPHHNKQLFILISCFLLLLYFRFSIVLSLLPALAVWKLIEHPLPGRRLLILACSGTLALLLLIFLLPGFFQSLAVAIAQRQKEFVGLEGHSRLPLPVMDGTWTGLLKVLPSATRNGLFEPLPGSGGQTIYLAFSFELLLIWCFFLLTLIRPRRHSALASPSPSSTLAFISCCLTFALSGLLLTGMIVPFAGAIVRYRSIFLPFLIAPVFYWLHSRPFFGAIDSWIKRSVFLPPQTR